MALSHQIPAGRDPVSPTYILWATSRKMECAFTLVLKRLGGVHGVTIENVGIIVTV
jgi:hypothetical protein